jgi:hypothetical protein
MDAPKIKRVFDSGTRKTISPVIEPPASQEELIGRTVENNTYLPNGVHLSDIDTALIGYVSEEINMTVKQAKVPVYDFSRQRFAEKFQTWLHEDDNNTLSLPFIAISRNSMPIVGTNLNNAFNIPSEELWAITRVKKIDSANNEYYENYKIPQPVNIDLNYKLEVFANLQREINLIDEAILSLFSQRQVYLDVKGHYMPLILSNLNNNTKEEIEKRRFYSHVYSLDLKGYILNEDNFRKLDSIKQVKANLEFEKPNKNCYVNTSKFKDNNEVCLLSLKFLFKRKGVTELEFLVKDNLYLYADNQGNVSQYRLYINDTEVFLPASVSKNDIIKVEKSNPTQKDFLIELYAEKI